MHAASLMIGVATTAMRLMMNNMRRMMIVRVVVGIVIVDMIVCIVMVSVGRSGSSIAPILLCEHVVRR